MSKRILLLLMIAAVLLSGCAAEPRETLPPVTQTQAPTETEAPEEEEKTYAPDFTMVDADGNELKLSDFFGEPIVLNFWASWCGPCKGEMPDFDEAYRNYEGEIQFLMVNLTDGSYETLEGAKSFVESSGYSFPVYYDTASEAAITYGVNSIPRTYFIDSEGVLLAYAAQAIDAATLEQGISMIIEE
ncbi:MAG: TlpA family protein disulfide reductase [Oscillospiraceae bacterium]|nr:TlpA family protein disulfide reductase [Oscillospiraceae bacterium]